MRNVMKIEQLCDKMILKVLSNNFNFTEGDIKDFVLKFGHDEDEYCQELKWDLHFNDMVSAEAFLMGWYDCCTEVMDIIEKLPNKSKGINKQEWVEHWTEYRGEAFQFPLSFEVFSDEPGDVTLTGFIHWNPEDVETFKKFMYLSLAGRDLGYLVDINKDWELSLYKNGITWGQLELFV